MIARGRKWVRALMGLLLSVSLSGCTWMSGPRQVPGPVVQVELNLINFARFPLDALRSVVQAFQEQHPNVKVNIYGPMDRPVPPNQAAVFEGIDLLLVTALQLREMAGEGLLRELPAVRIPALEGALPEVVYDMSTVDGRRLGLPLGVSPVLIAADQERLSAAGIPLPPLDWTWADYEQAATLAQQAGLSSRMDAQYLLDATLRAYGGRAFDGERGVWMLAAPESVQGLAQIARLAERGTLQIEGPGGPPDENVFFVVTSLHEAPDAMRLYPLPRGPKGRPTPVEGILASIPTAAAHPELAAEFAGLLASKAAQLHLARTGIRPVSDDEEVLAAWREAVGDRTVSVWELVVNDLYVEQLPVYRTELLNRLAPYFRGEAQLDSVIADLTRRASKP